MTELIGNRLLQRRHKASQQRDVTRRQESNVNVSLLVYCLKQYHMYNVARQHSASAH